MALSTSEKEYLKELFLTKGIVFKYISSKILLSSAPLEKFILKNNFLIFKSHFYL